ncbi:hypothetical protein [Psychromonas arctica]|uniref:hypothetical protein n=1 Tax=Psychromonas arctica TaxID=168275 RepID=UPI00041EA818|nr:hypothetical protein [Psychromonas arctica]
MKTSELPEYNKYIHNIRNSLNSISLHAELGKMLIENGTDKEQMLHALTVILQECKNSEIALKKIGKNNTEEE